MKWEVTSQAPATRLDPSGRGVVGYDVHVKTDTGHTDTVFVPAGDYTVDGVRAAVESKLGAVKEIANLTGEV